MTGTSSSNRPQLGFSRFTMGLDKARQGVILFLEVIGLRPARQEVDHTDRIVRLKRDYLEFRRLLSANNSFLETMADMEYALQHQSFIDQNNVKRMVLRAIADIYIMTGSLIDLSKGRHQALQEVLDGITSDLTRLFESTGRTPAPTWIRDLTYINQSHAALAGGKMANLGEIRNGLGLPTPDGFVVTTEAFQLLLEKGGIRSWIQDKDLELPTAPDMEGESRAIREQIINIQVPSSLKEAILGAYDRLTAASGKKVSLAVRSSALGEDSHFSFAGQFLTLLNLGRDQLVEAYLKVAASLYSPEAIHYRLLHKIPSRWAEMAVGFLTMVDAQASGVIFSKDPNHPGSNQILIQTVRGLGVPLVEGQTSPEAISLGRNLDKAGIRRSLSRQKTYFTLSLETGLQEAAIDPDQARESSLTDEEILLLGRWALLLEGHFRGPQDIEWAKDREGNLYLLQSRPLGLIRAASRANLPVPGRVLLLSGGEVAYPGIGTGRAVHLAAEDDLDSFPDGGILIARRSSPKFIRIMSKTRAIVTDFGSTTGHMASLAREFRVPALLNTRTATRKIPPGALITVDVAGGLIYKGEVPLSEENGLSTGPIYPAELNPVTPELQLLKKVSELILPLHLTDPRSGSFKADHCLTLHDLARFIHEKSYEEMFILGGQIGDLRASSAQLDVFLPIDLYLIDLGGGIKGLPKKGKVKRSQISSIPLEALLEGMMHEKIPRFGPKPMDLRGFFSIMMRHAVNNPEKEGSFQDPCYAIISDHYLNYTARVGYHFSVVDTYCGNTPNKNYISLNFGGGAADLIRRRRRAETIAAILKEYGFQVDLHHDVVTARLGKSPRDEMIGHIKMIGSLFQFFRQMDVSMVSDDSADGFKAAFLRGEYDFQPKNS
jgi:pyruvate, water dikinase